MWTRGGPPWTRSTRTSSASSCRCAARGVCFRFPGWGAADCSPKQAGPRGQWQARHARAVPGDRESCCPAEPRVSCPDGWVIQTCHRCPEGVCVARPPRPPSDGSFVSAFRGGKRPRRCLGSSAVPSRCKRRSSGGCGQPSLSGGTSGAVSRDASSRKVAEALR